jgi:general stress protein 26
VFNDCVIRYNRVMLSRTMQRTLVAALGRNKLAVLATLSSTGSLPQSSLVAFAEDVLPLRVYIQSKRYARKTRNMDSHPNVSLVTGWQLSRGETVQLEGLAQRVTDTATLRHVAARFRHKRSPTTPSYLSDPLCVVFVIVPTWIRYSRYSASPPAVWEAVV